MKNHLRSTPVRPSQPLRKTRIAFAIALIGLSPLALAQVSPVTPAVTPTGGNTNTYIAPNGVTVVNINTANAAGISSNKYTTYNVPTNGLVLNNGTTAQIEYQTQLAGAVLANVNLATAAKVIVNQVVSTNRSTLAGYTEVAGTKADVIVANPNGITCSGCGFINTSHVTLTTGMPGYNADGSLSGFTVTGGDILINGNGLDGSTQQLLDLVTRSLKIDGKISAGDEVGIFTGPIQWSYASRSVTGATTPDANKPAYAIDSTVLGGMYAGRINIVATEAGVGVRMLGEAAATVDDFTLTSAGKVEIQSAISAEHNNSIKTTSSTGTDDLLLTGSNAKLAAKNDLNLQVDGALRVSSGQLYAANALALAANSLNNQGSIIAMGNLGLTASSLTNGDTNNSSAVILGAMNGNGATTYTVTNTVNNYGALHSGGNFTLNAKNISNQSTGGISSLATLAATASNGNITNDGAFYAGSALNLTTTGTGYGIYNRTNGTLDSDGNITTTSYDFVNNGGVTAMGNIDIRVTNSFTNETTLENGVTISKDKGVAVDVPGSESENQIAEETGFFGYDGMNAYVIDKQVTQTEYLVGITEKELTDMKKAQIIGAGNSSTISIDYANSGLNYIAVISAPTVNITGKSTGTFTNEDLSLYELTESIRIVHVYDSVVGSSTNYDYARIDPNPSVTTNGKDYVEPGSKAGDEWTPGGCDLNSAGCYVPAGSGWAEYDSRDQAWDAAVQGAQIVDGVKIKSFGAGIFATTLNISGGTLNNVGSPWPNATDKAIADSSKTAKVAQPGGNTSLPTNPNGYFVISKKPDSKYLIETNPLFQVGANFLGSDYLEQLMGVSPDDTLIHLGDANYEAYLIRQQLIEQTGSNVIKGYGNEEDQIQRLMDQAFAESQKLGLVYGQALTPEQIANLTEDIVWMVKTVVNGIEVLTPVVYLAPATLAMVTDGATISGDNTTITGEGLNNTGGTIAGSNNLKIEVKGDVTNTSGTITGGNVSVTSTEGSIINQTMAVTSGDDLTTNTAIGKTGGIVATGNLDMKAEKDITVLGADVKAASASLEAGGDVTFDTIVDKTTKSSSSSSGGFLSSSSTSTSTTTETNIGSNLDIGGNLSIKSGGDTTIAGSKANIGGNLDVDAGGDFNVIARQDKVTTTSSSSESGLGVGGGLYGTTTTTTTDFTGTNVGSTLNVGGDAKVKAEGTMTVQGSDVSIAGNADIDAKEGVKILDGLDEKRTTTTTETTTFGKFDSPSDNASASAGTSTGPTGASANAEASTSGSIKLMETTTTTSNSGSNTSVASNFKVGGNLDIKTEGTVTVQGSNVESGGDMNIDAKNVEVLTGRNETWSNTTTTSNSIGIYDEAKASANASGGADNSASASVEATRTFGAQETSSSSTDYTLTNSSSSLKSGGNMNIKAEETATFVGANVEAGGNINVEATDITNKAAQDITYSSQSSSKETAGLYVGAEAKASANANSGSASAEAGVSAGIRYSGESSFSEEGTSTAVTNTFKAGGDINRTASGTILDQGTQMEAGGNINQSATTIIDQAAANTSFSNSSANQLEVKAGVGASAGASTTGGADAGAGVRVSADGSISNSSTSNSTAVTSSYKAGGNISSTSTNGTSLEGTNFEAGGNVDITGGTVDYKAAKNTSTSSSDSLNASANLSVDFVGGGVDSASLDASLNTASSNSNSSDAVVGNIKAGGNVNIKSTSGDTTLEGTSVNAGGTTSVSAAGAVNLEEAKSSSTSSADAVSANISLSASKGKDGGEGKSGAAAGVGATSANSSSSSSQGVNLNGGNGVVITEGGK
ncbi:MAG: hemagglutinin repeat-containing protein [Azonexus sp.]|jgi:filamentous hemagglutinin family protein|nr:hemagglutinin repeat-containing protein [Azonexus sp.]